MSHISVMYRMAKHDVFLFLKNNNKNILKHVFCLILCSNNIGEVKTLAD